MFIQNIISEIRKLLFDVNEPYLWSTDELLSYIRDTINDIYATTLFTSGLIREITTSANTPSYFIGGNVVRAWEVEENVFFNRVPFDVYRSLPPAVSKPDTFSVLDNTLYLYPTPDNTYTIRLFYQHIPSSLSLSDDLLFPDIELVKLGVAWRAYLKQDSEIFDEKAYTKFRQEYTASMARFKNAYVRDWHYPEISKIHKGLL